ncbi:MAG: preprotein translocase subunit YajC [Planctomycetota bacterium]
MLHPAFLLLLQDGATPAAPPAAGGSAFSGMLLPLVLCAVVFYFLVIGPERKQRKKRDLMLKNIGKGDKVMTTGGLYGTVAGVQDDVLTLQVAEGVRMRFSRSAVQSVISDEVPVAEKVTETAKK